MNPVRLLKIYSRANRLISLFQGASASYERTNDVSKSLFASKTFWIQVLTAAAELSGVLPIPAGVATMVGSIATIVVRTLTSQPVHVLPRN